MKIKIKSSLKSALTTVPQFRKPTKSDIIDSNCQKWNLLAVLSAIAGNNKSDMPSELVSNKWFIGTD